MGPAGARRQLQLPISYCQQQNGVRWVTKFARGGTTQKKWHISPCWRPPTSVETLEATPSSPFHGGGAAHDFNWIVRLDSSHLYYSRQSTFLWSPRSNSKIRSINKMAICRRERSNGKNVVNGQNAVPAAKAFPGQKRGPGAMWRPGGNGRRSA